MATRESADVNLYRIVPFERLVQLLSTDQLHFSHPSVWDDPYETLITHARSSEVFAQCWCRKGVSDAMWRIYSPHRLSVRIHTTSTRLASALTKAASLGDFWFKVANVRYVNPFEYMTHVAFVKSAIQRGATNHRIASSLFLKRRAFDHEAEVRVVVVPQATAPGMTNTGLKVKVNARELIDHVMLDPRAPDEFVDIYSHYLHSTLGFKGKVLKSQLYASGDAREH